jgi:hypothetical protein
MIFSNDGGLHIVLYVRNGFICLMCDIIIPIKYRLFGDKHD